MDRYIVRDGVFSASAGPNAKLGSGSPAGSLVSLRVDGNSEMLGIVEIISIWHMHLH